MSYLFFAVGFFLAGDLLIYLLGMSDFYSDPVSLLIPSLTGVAFLAVVKFCILPSEPLFRLNKGLCSFVSYILPIPDAKCRLSREFFYLHMD